MAFIKSHSNYVLKKLHQTTNNGNIWERDITTIGGLNQFSPGQVPIYKSSNFVITINNENTPSRNMGSIEWEQNGICGETWTNESISGLVETEIDENTEIVLKQDFYDLREFAYYGSCVELIRGSMTDIMNRFPGEMYVCSQDEKVKYYTTNQTGTNERSTTLPFGEHLILNDDGEPLFSGICVDTSVVIADDAEYEPFEYSGLTASELNKPNYEVYTREAMTYNDSGCIGSELCVIDNPFGINIHSPLLPGGLDENAIFKYFANNGFENYVLVDPDGNETDVLWDGFDIAEICYNIGDMLIESGTGIDAPLVKDSDEGRLYAAGPQHEETSSRPTETNPRSNCNTPCFYISNMPIWLYMGENGEIVYMTVKEYAGYHVRPKKEFLTKFYRSLDMFQKVILDPTTNPKYQVTFQVIRENSFGYYSQMETFTFPQTYGGYNISINNNAYMSYVQRLQRIAEFYDERFCDNLYRSMTPESMTNFDFTRVYDEEIQNEYIESGDRIKKTIRLWGREYDEIKAYIDSIQYMNRITYNERGNMPSYFLTDVLENDGWDVKLVFPYDLYETDADDNEASGYTREIEIENIPNGFYHHFSQISTGSVQPYATSEAYFKYGENGNTGDSVNWINECNELVWLRRKYTTDEEYTFSEINNEFLRRMKLNSRALLRSKGTIHGVEMLLSLFGFKSGLWNYKKNGYDTLYVSDNIRATYNGDSGYSDNDILDVDYVEKGYDYDYEITEQIVTSDCIIDCWDESKQMHLIDWYNSKKAISYDYDTTSSDVTYVPYQGLPVKYFQTDSKDIRSPRILFPNFEKDEQIDGNPYYQMNGGWEMKKIHDHEYFNFMFDKNGDNLTNTDTEEGRMFHETLRNVKNVSNIKQLFEIPLDSISDKDVYYVSNIYKDNYAFINGEAYKLYTKIDGDEVKYYVKLTVKNSSIIITGKYPMIFTNNVTVLDENYEEAYYNITYLPDGYVIEAYYDQSKTDKSCFVLRGVDEFDAISYFDVFIDGKSNAIGDKEPTKYFQMKDLCDGANAMFSDGTTPGWKQLATTDYLYLRLSSILDYFKGNNPHNGKFSYDNGYEYLNYYSRIFNYAIDNDLFDERCFDDYITDIEKIKQVGFDIVDTDKTNYEDRVVNDRKVNAYLSYYDESGNTFVYTRKEEDTTGEYVQGKHPGAVKATMSTLADNGNGINLIDAYVDGDSNFYENISCENKTFAQSLGFDDFTTNHYVNTKLIHLKFYLKSEDWYSRSGLAEMRYIDSIVIPYVEQMIPSNAILSIEYEDAKTRGGGNSWEPVTYNILNNSSLKVGVRMSDGNTIEVDSGSTDSIDTTPYYSISSYSYNPKKVDKTEEETDITFDDACTAKLTLSFTGDSLTYKINNTKFTTTESGKEINLLQEENFTCPLTRIDLSSGLPITSIDFSQLDTSNVVSFASMFYNDDMITDFSSLSNWDTSKVVEMSSMFHGCSGLTSLDFMQNWDTSSLTSVGYMFNVCKNLTDISAIGSWDATKIRSLSGLFRTCPSLSDISVLSNWDVSNVTDMMWLFDETKVSDLSPLSEWNVGKVRYMSSMFYATPITNVDALSKWDTSSNTTLMNTFASCRSLANLNGLSGWNTSNVTTLSSTFSSCSSLTTLSGLENWDTSKVVEMSSMFHGCSGLTSLDFMQNWDTSSLTSVGYMFNVCRSLANLNGLSGWNTSNVTTLSSTFSSCSSLTTLSGLENWDTSKVTDMGNTFGYNHALTNIDAITGWNTSSVTTMAGMFWDDSSLTSLDLSHWSTKSLTKIVNYNTSNKSYNGMFAFCSALVDLDLSNWDLTNIADNSGEHTDGCYNLFSYCSSLQSIHVANCNDRTIERLLYALENSEGIGDGEWVQKDDYIVRVTAISEETY